MIDKAIDLLKMVNEDVKNNKPLCPFPQRNLIYLNYSRHGVLTI